MKKILPILFLLMGSLTLPAAHAGSRVEWARWTKHGPPVWEGWAIAADPSILEDDGVFRMFYTGWLPGPDRTVLAEAVSPNGLDWSPALPVDGTNPVPVVLDGRPGEWDAQVETSFAIRRDGRYLLYYCGYPRSAEPVGPGELGAASSKDGLHFTRVSNEPLLRRSAGWYDNDAIFSPSLVWWKAHSLEPEKAWLVYAGHCWTNCSQVSPGLRILGAASTDGVTWLKEDRPVAEAPLAGLGWTAGGVAEPDLVRGPDGLFYLFFSAFSGEDGDTVQIGVARSPHPLGPWEADPQPIVATSDPGGWEGTEVIAPSVLVDGGKVRLWYHGFQKEEQDFRIGYAETSWPLMRIGTDWERSPSNPLVNPFGAMVTGATDLAVADPTIIWDEDDGIFKGWWSTTVAGEFGPDGPSINGIRYAESPDGLHWTVQQELAFSAAFGDPGAWDSDRSETPFVVKVPSNPPERRYLLYYSGGNLGACSVGEAPCYEIGLAFSADGKQFSRLPAGESPYGEAGLVLRGEEVLHTVEGMALGVVADPTLILEPDGTLRMWMSAYAEDADHSPLAFGISEASSPDGIHWTPAAVNPLPSLRRPGEVAAGQQPSVLYNPRTNLYEMWFTNDRERDQERTPATLFQAFGYWHATSPDGIQWTPEYGEEPDFRWDPVYPSERWGLLTGVHVLLHEGRYMMYYSGWSAVDVPPLFLVPTRRGLVDGVTALDLAIRPEPGPAARKPQARAVPR